MFHKSKWILLFLFFSTSSVFAQEFVKTKAIQLFNEGHFKEVVQFAKGWMQSHPEEASIAAYFSAESEYNLGLENAQLGNARNAFRKAYKWFDKLSSDAVFRQEYPHFFEMAVYKKGWCLFRRAETGENHVTLFKLAADDFTAALSLVPDSLQSFLIYMASEAKYQDATLKFYTYFMDSPDAMHFSDLQKEITQARSGFEKLQTRPEVPRNLKIAAQIRTKDCFFLSGKLFQNIPNAIFQKMVFQNKAATPVATARKFLTDADYLSISAHLTAAEKKTYGAALTYLQAMRELNLHWTDGGTRSVAQFKKLLANLRRQAEFHNEILFRRGNLVQTDARVDSKDFFELSRHETSFYAKASTGIPEALYWLGVVQHIRNDYDDSRENLVQFVKANPFPILDPRLEILVEDAKLRKYSIDFEEFSTQKNRTGLMELRNALNSFTPHIQRIQKEKQKLIGLIRLELGENLWTKILSGSPEQKLQIALDMIRDILPRAAVTTGQKRDHYLRQLDKIFEVTSHRKSNETTFYKGISLALRAEIQPSQEQKDNTFIAAAKMLEQVQSPYDLEAKYVAARSDFFAGRYDRAKSGFEFLINHAHSLRSLYYLGEIYRLQKNYIAARKCFETIMAKVKDSPEGRFWYDNAKASLDKCRSGGNPNEIKGLDLSHVQFPDRLLVVNGETISYEKLANPAYLEKQAIELANGYLKKFGLPKKSIYPSVNLLRRSMLQSENLFATLNAGIQDKKGAIMANLILWVINEKGKPYASEVTLNGTVLEPPYPKNPYVVRNIPLNTTLSLKIEAIGYYPIKKTISLSQPNDNELIVPLSERVNYSNISKTVPPGDFQLYRKAVDRIVLLTNSSPRIPEQSKLSFQLNKYFSFRDVAYHPGLEEFLVTDSFNGKILKYNASGIPSSTPSFKVVLPDSIKKLKTPEGITVDSEGKIYIADWALHRILVLNSDGSFIRQIGGVDNGNFMEKRYRRLVFPKKIAIEEDAKGILFKGKKIFREKHILVSDLFGIQKFTTDGRLLDSYLFKPKEYALDTFYGLAIMNYGADSQLYVYDRKNQKIMIFPAQIKIQ